MIPSAEPGPFAQPGVAQESKIKGEKKQKQNRLEMRNQTSPYRWMNFCFLGEVFFILALYNPQN